MLRSNMQFSDKEYKRECLKSHVLLCLLFLPSSVLSATSPGVLFEYGRNIQTLSFISQI